MLNFDFDQSIVVSLSSGRVGGHMDEEVEVVCGEAKEGRLGLELSWGLICLE